MEHLHLPSRRNSFFAVVDDTDTPLDARTREVFGATYQELSELINCISFLLCQQRFIQEDVRPFRQTCAYSDKTCSVTGERIPEGYPYVVGVEQNIYSVKAFAELVRSKFSPEVSFSELAQDICEMQLQFQRSTWDKLGLLGNSVAPAFA